MKYQVPQFIDTEVKLIGPFTLRQFLYLAIGGVMIFMLNFLLSGVFFMSLSLIIAIFFVAMAFLKIEGMPLPNYIAISIGYLLNNRRYTYGNESSASQFTGYINTERETTVEQKTGQDNNNEQVVEKFG